MTVPSQPPLGRSWIRWRHLATAALLLLVSACGGGGGSAGGAGSVDQPTIIASVIIFPANGVPPGLAPAGYNAAAGIRITDQTGAPVTTASVSVNGTLLTYIAANQQFEAALNIHPGDNVEVQVDLNGVTYTASRQNFGTYPTITAPSANSTWSGQADNVVSWSGAAPDSTSQYAVGILDTGGALVWPTNGKLMAVSSSTTSVTISAGSVSIGSRLVLVGIVDVMTISGAANGSGLVIGGFSYVPIAVGASGVPTAIVTSPASVTVGIGKSTQLTATATLSDGSTQDVTAQATWSSADTTIATIGSTGVVTGVAGGTTTVTAQYAGFSASTSVSVFQPNPSPTPPLSQSVTYQVDYAHSGQATVGGIGPTFPPTSHWATTLAGTSISYPVIAGGNVFVLTNAAPAAGSYGTTLYALDEQTGGVAWGPTPIPGTYSIAGLAYDHGTLFVVNFDGFVRTFDAATGAAGWSEQLPRTSQVTSAPTAVNGILYVTGDGGLQGIEETNGNVIFDQNVGADHSSPSVSADGVFQSNPCWAQKMDPIGGTVLWTFAEGCSGGGGKTVAYANNAAYVRGLQDSATLNSVDLILDAGTGKQIGTFKSQVIPAFSATTGYFLSGGALNATGLGTGSQIWSFAGDGQLVSAPIVIDHVVVIGSASGTVYALDNAGNVIWSGSAGAPISGPDEQNATVLTGFGAGDGYLVVPAGNVLNGWRLIP